MLGILWCKPPQVAQKMHTAFNLHGFEKRSWQYNQEYMNAQILVSETRNMFEKKLLKYVQSVLKVFVVILSTTLRKLFFFSFYRRYTFSLRYNFDKLIPHYCYVFCIN